MAPDDCSGERLARSGHLIVVVGRGIAERWRLEPSLQARALHHSVEPVLHRGIVADVELRPFVRQNPRPARDVGDREFVTGHIGVLRQLRVEHAEQTMAFTFISRDHRGQLLRKIMAKHIKLADHRAKAGHQSR